MPSRLALSAALLAALSPGLTGAELWIEGEAAADAQVQRHPWWYDKVKTDQLSGADFISHWSDKADGLVTYNVQAAEAGSYTLWLRANPTGAKLSWQLDGGEWKLVDFGAKVDEVNLAADGKPDVRFMAWVKVGAVQLASGAHKLGFKMHSENNHHGSIDCLLLTTGSFTPKGTRKPGEAGAPALSLDGRWGFDPDADEFKPEALLDLRNLNEKVAGETGFVGRDAKGDFTRGDGSPLRFWAFHSDVWQKNNLEALETHARFLAKRGVNLVRCHGNVGDQGGALDALNPAQRESMWKCVAAMKKQGIYTIISPYYPHATGLDDAKRQRWGLSQKGNMTGLVYFHPKVQAAYKAWLKELLTPPNPHTGIALKDEPSLAVIQMQNEDSLLFWTVASIDGPEGKMLQERFAAWAAKKHGSIEKALEAWKEPIEGDAPAEKRVALRHIWDLTSAGVAQKGRGLRTTDQARFLGELMHEWHAEVGRYLKEELKAKQLVNAGNWKTADAVTLGDIERWSYTANEVQAVNRYTGGAHSGQHNGWAVVAGDKFSHYSGLLEPTTIPVSLKQPVGSPMMLPESSWVPPTMHQSEAPMLVGAYMALTGVDAYFWFASGDTQWTDPKSANGYLDSVGKWIAATPELLGNFPAAALMYRNAYVKRGEAVVHEERSHDDMFGLKIPVISEEGGFDVNRDASQFAAGSTVKQEVSRLAYLAGPVEVVYGGDPAKTTVHAKLGELVDEKAKLVKSVTGELSLDYGKGVMRIDAPKAQGVTGFLAKHSPTTELSSLTVETKNDYAAILAVPLDDQPLASSKRVLVQMGTHCRPTGWSEKPATWKEGETTIQGFEIVEHGAKPWQIVRNDCRITLKNPGITEVVVLDMNGMQRGTVPVEKVAGGVRFAMPADAKYVIAR